MDLKTAAERLLNNAELSSTTLHLALGECNLSIRSNSEKLITGLQRYFAHVVSTQPEQVDMDIIAIEQSPPELGVDFVDWAREPGKTGRKDSYFDIPDARLVRKIRTGMVFLQSETYRIAAGPCEQYDNQVINFINAQYMNWLQQRGWFICHASGLVHHGQGLGIAGFSGGGKSTLMLQLLDKAEVSYLTNDRLFAKEVDGQIQMAGIPKLPRVNPGTIVHNPKLHSLLSEQRRQELLALPPQQLWDLEEKYDVLVDDVYGHERILQQAPLNAFLVLNWQRNSPEPLKIDQVDLAQRPELLGAIMKSPGPFYQMEDGRFWQDTMPFDEAGYLNVLKTVTVYEASGGLDFIQLQQWVLDELLK
jgi:HprK-related kinase B